MAKVLDAVVDRVEVKQSRQGKGKLLQDFLTQALQGASGSTENKSLLTLRLCLCHGQAWAGSTLLWFPEQVLLSPGYCFAAKLGTTADSH